MPINWNEVDKTKLKNIQRKEAAKTKYEEDLKAYKEKLKNKGFFGKLFNCLEKPECFYLPDFNPYIYKIGNSFCISAADNNIVITDPCECLQSEYANQIIKYLDLNESNKITDCKEYYAIDDTEENRKKVDKVVALVEKYIGKKQKEAETYIDNYINNKEGK